MQLHTGISDVSEDWSSFHIYPNPVRDNLMIQTGRKESYWYSIQDMLGKSYLGGHVQDGAVIDVAGLPRGIYVVSVGGRVFKLIKD
ncbi:MAG: T9SS type A sorting domain-containing protein [Chitinophagales bacterium]